MINSSYLESPISKSWRAVFLPHSWRSKNVDKFFSELLSIKLRNLDKFDKKPHESKFHITFFLKRLWRDFTDSLRVWSFRASIFNGSRMKAAKKIKQSQVTRNAARHSDANSAITPAEFSIKNESRHKTQQNREKEESRSIAQHQNPYHQSHSEQKRIPWLNS